MTTEAARRATGELPVLLANSFHALARAYSPPDSWPEDLPELIESATGPLGGDCSRLGRDLAALIRGEENWPESLAPAHARLFIGPFDIQAPPWASLYLDPEQQLMGEASRYAAKAYADAGLGPVAGPADAPDHLTRELEFMYFLAYREYESEDPLWRTRQENFWQQHLGAWLPQVATLVRDASDDVPVYRSLAELTLAFCHWLDSGISFHTSNHP